MSPSKCPSFQSKKIKQRAPKRLQRAANLSSLVKIDKGKPGRKRQHWKIRNRVGMKVEKLKKVILNYCIVGLHTVAGNVCLM